MRSAPHLSALHRLAYERSRSSLSAHALAEELHTLANWISLEGISVERKGNLAKALAAAL